MQNTSEETKEQAVSEEKINHNGFTNSPPLTQVMPPIIVVLSLTLTAIPLHIQVSNVDALVALDIGLVLNFLLVGWLWYLATKIVPTDSVQLRHLESLKKG